MKDNLTDITVVLDRSGSMETVKSDTEGGFNRFIDDQKKAQGEAVLTLVQFDTDYEFVHKAKPIKDIPKLNLVPRGGTALLDAIGKAITETGERLDRTPDHEKPGKVVFVILTDGEENSSKEYKKPQINEKIKHQQDKYGWQFVFLGANQDAIQAGMSYGIPMANSMTYAANAAGTKAAFSTTSTNLVNMRAGVAATMAYSEKDREEAEGPAN